MNKTYEEGYIAGFNHNIEVVKELENQQKEFIEYLKDKLRIANEVLDNPEEDEEARGYVLARKFILEEILSKYQEIIGVVNENNT